MSLRSVGTSDALHTHLTIGLRPVGECPACDQVHAVFGSQIGHSEHDTCQPVPAE